MKTLKILALVCFISFNLQAENILENQLSDSLTAIANLYASVGRVKVENIETDTKNKTIAIKASESLSQIPFRPENVKRIYNMLGNMLIEKYPNYSILCVTDKRLIEDLIPNFYREKDIDQQRLYKTSTKQIPLLTNLSKPYGIKQGLENRHIALWQSHGRYYNQKEGRWIWQRAPLFHTVEDLYTQSYVLPYLVPMLENAGATVFLPRERDTQNQELIIDNDDEDNHSKYHESTDRKNWKTVENGFANPKKIYTQGENPFSMGTYRLAQAIDDNDELSYAEWIPSIPENGYYGVYVSYKTVENSCPDARYTVYHKGGKTEFKVNQTMNGGTWLFLGFFNFEKGRDKHFKVVLSNYSSYNDKMVTADAVKIGGGLGNIARYPNEDGAIPNFKSSDNTNYENQKVVPENLFPPTTSGYPRYTEAARYWLQWAGMPDSIYSKNKGANDYTDDFQSRALWVNYLAGGSSVLPQRSGLNVPIDMAFAFHSDAGTTYNDSIIGTLGIYTVSNDEGKSVYYNNYSRWGARELTDLIQTQIVDDIRKSFSPEWTRRGMWNKSYNESRVPEVPTMLLELLSHQNFADMRFGLDPRFRFAVSRAIYKGMLKFICYNAGTPYIVQPLPVSNMRSKFIEKNKIELSWKASIDSLEPTAKSEAYVLYTRIDGGGFNNGIVINNNRVVIEIQPGKIYSFKITATNLGGESFPSEILSVCRVNNNKPEIMIVNGFDRTSAPISKVLNKNTAGFYFDEDPGVPYLNDYAFIGKQYEFDRTKPWLSDDNPGFGASSSDFETQVIAGNNFDYPYLHGKSIKAAGYSFVSCSLSSVLEGEVNLNNYKMLDLILGKQKQTNIGIAKKEVKFKTFTLALQKQLSQYCLSGGNLLISGAFIGSDFYKDNYINTEERIFMENILKFKFRSVNPVLSSKVKILNSPLAQFDKTEMQLYTEPNENSYFVESTDVIEPAGNGSLTICRYSNSNLGAGVAYLGQYKTCLFGFPFETIQSEKERNKLMSSILSFFSLKSAKK